MQMRIKKPEKTQNTVFELGQLASAVCLFIYFVLLYLEPQQEASWGSQTMDDWIVVRCSISWTIEFHVLVLRKNWLEKGKNATSKYPYFLLPGTSIFVERISFHFLEAFNSLCVCIGMSVYVHTHTLYQVSKESMYGALLPLVGVQRKGSLVEILVLKIHWKIPFHWFGVTDILHQVYKLLYMELPHVP